MLNKIRSNMILYKVFGILKKRIKLKIIKYNKSLLDKLNISNQDFEDFKILKEFNQKFKLYIRDIDIPIFHTNEKY